jgi:hypothetical protein
MRVGKYFLVPFLMLIFLAATAVAQENVVEYFRLRDGNVQTIECYFGGNPPFRQQ